MEVKHILLLIVAVIVIGLVYIFLISPTFQSKKILSFGDSINENDLIFTLIDIQGQEKNKENRTIIIYATLENPAKIRLDVESYNVTAQLVGSKGEQYSPIDLNDLVKNNFTYRNLKGIKQLSEYSKIRGFYAFEVPKYTSGLRFKIKINDKLYIYLLNYSPVYEEIYDLYIENHTIFIDLLDQKKLITRFYIDQNNSLKSEKSIRSLARVDNLYNETSYAIEAEGLITKQEKENGSFRFYAVTKYKDELITLINKVLNNQKVDSIHFAICDSVVCEVALCNGSTFYFNGYCNKSSGNCIYDTYPCYGGCSADGKSCKKPLTLNERVRGVIPAAFENLVVYASVTDVFNSECNGIPITCFTLSLEAPPYERYSFVSFRHDRIYTEYYDAAYARNGTPLIRFDECSPDTIYLVSNSVKNYNFCYSRGDPLSFHIELANYPGSVGGMGAAVSWTFYILNETDLNLINDPSLFIKEKVK